MLSTHASRYGIQLTDSQRELFRIYLDELCLWNQKVNLTGLKDKERMVIELLLDSLIPAPFLPREGRMLDVGSGAGLPGVPLKIHNPRLQIDLLEINLKKVSFLRQVIRLMKLEKIQVIKGRVEGDRKGLNVDGYHVVTARALAAFPQTVAWCAPLLCQDGVLVGFLGASAAGDFRGSQEIMEKHGLVIERVWAYSLPGRRAERTSVIIRKEGQGMKVG